jgi:hypothetical protein
VYVMKKIFVTSKMELTFKDTLMFYQTALRNVGLYTSISLALLGYSRFYRGKGNSLYNVAFVIISMIFLLMAILILHKLINNLNFFMTKLSEDEKGVIREWLVIPETLRYVLYVVLGFSLLTLYRQTK